MRTRTEWKKLLCFQFYYARDPISKRVKLIFKGNYWSLIGSSNSISCFGSIIINCNQDNKKTAATTKITSANSSQIHTHRHSQISQKLKLIIDILCNHIHFLQNSIFILSFYRVDLKIKFPWCFDALNMYFTRARGMEKFATKIFEMWHCESLTHSVNIHSSNQLGMCQMLDVRNVWYPDNSCFCI